MHKLIIVDDDELIRKGLEKVIPWQELGFEVAGVFSNACSALDFLKCEKVHVILTDIKMRGMTGLQLIHQAKQYNEDIKAVIISGYSEFELAKEALTLKVEDYLLKPLEQAEIERVFKKIKAMLDEDKHKNYREKSEKLQKEYELMKLLSSRVDIEHFFKRTTPEQKYFELIVIKIFGTMDSTNDRKQLNEFHEMTKDILSKYIFCNVWCFFAALIPPKSLNGLLLQLKKEFAKFPKILYKIAVGKEVYFSSELIDSYWSAMDLISENEKNSIIYFDSKRNSCKKDRDVIQELKNELVDAIENGYKFKIDELVENIGSVLKPYDYNDVYYFYNNIINTLIKYFQIENNEQFIFNQYMEIDSNPADCKQLHVDFKRDIRHFIDIVRENSDSIRNIIVNKAKQMIEQNYANNTMTLASLANHLNVSYGYLSTIFTKSTKKSFKTYLTEIRMEKARTLIISRKYKVYEIAEMVGYNNPRYFTDAFTKYYHCSPTDYISRLRGEKAVEENEND